ncbi:amino acid ABC transporter substrate-binding protein [bacterium]|nr:amino acid ABC transporter substrate-binding protein [bacterium]
MKLFKSLIVLFALILATAGLTFGGETLDKVKKEGFIKIGVNGGVHGFSAPDSNGVWKGLDVDTARAIAVAVFGDYMNRIRYVPLTAVQRFTALQSGEVDVLTRNATQTLSRDTALGLDFVTVNYYDGQGFMVDKALGVSKASELGGATVCVLPGTTTELNAADFFRTKNMTWKPVVIENTTELSKAFFAGRCDVITSDISQLAGIRAGSANPGKYKILPDVISKEPLAPAVRHGDNQWKDIVNYAVLALINAEELGITSQNVDQMLESKDPKVQRFLGVIPGNGKALGLEENWAYRIVKLVGNYGEVFERNVGPNTTVGLERGLNALWTNGGLMYSPPFK